MDRKRRKNDTVPQFTCDKDFIVHNTSLLGTNCFVVQRTFPEDVCFDVCDNLRARLPNYSEFMALNATRVKGKCKGGFCNLEIDANFNFATHKWQSNNQQLDGVTWRSRGFPILNDLLVICNLMPEIQYRSTAWVYVQPTPYLCLMSSSRMDINRTDYFNWEFDRYKY